MELDLKSYLMVISFAGSVLLLIFMIMAFCNVENFEIPKKKNVQSGLILMIGSIFYFCLGILMYFLSMKEEKEKANPSKNSIEERQLDTMSDREDFNEADSLLLSHA